jgi:uncharacterized protein (TIGR03545 family)
MALKAPGIFSKRINEKDFQNRIMKKTFSESDNAYLTSLFSKDRNGIYSISKDLKKEDIKRLKKISKTVKGNTGIVLKGRLIVLGIIIVAIFVSYFVFKDMILAGAARSALEGIFGARAEINGFVFDIAGPRISLTRLSVANRDEPFSNLFELGKTELNLNFAELLKGRVDIKNIQASEIQWGTKRSFSGALPGAVAKKQETKKDEKGFTFSLAGIDVKSILESQKSSFKGIAALERANTKLSALKTKWSGKPEMLNKDINELSDSVKGVLGINIQNLKTAQDVQNALVIVDKATKKSDAVKNSVKKTFDEFSNDQKIFNDEQKAVQEALASDYKLVESFINIPSGGAGGLIASVAERFLNANIGSVFSYSRIALDALKNLNKGKTKKEEKQAPVIRHGIVIEFPGATTPQFLLENGSFSLGKPGSMGYMSGNIKNVSSNAELVGKPVVFDYYQKFPEADIIVSGSCDARESAARSVTAHIQVQNLALSLQEGLALLGITNATGVCSMTNDVSLDRSGACSGSVSVLVSKLAVKKSNDADKVKQILSDIIAKTDTINVSATYRFDSDGTSSVKLQSSLDSLVASGVGKLIDDSINEAKKSIRDELDKSFGTSLDENNKLGSVMDDTKKAFDTDQSKINGFDKQIAEKKKAIEDQGKKALGGNILQGIDNLFK